jgi:ADP-ribose pyrophosphatase YjhB (NUDIX family)
MNTEPTERLIPQERPCVDYTADIVVKCRGEILVVERGKYPLGVALPGGGVHRRERGRPAAARELLEETGIRVDPDALLPVPGEWDHPDRDPRRRTVTAAYTVSFGERPDVVAGDDAAAFVWVSIESIMEGRVAFAFPDHAEIITAALGVLATPNTHWELDRINEVLREAGVATGIGGARALADNYATAKSSLDAVKEALKDAGVVGLIGAAGVRILGNRHQDARTDLADLMDRLKAGDASDGHHTHRELYEFRLLLHAHAVRDWIARGYTVVKSWRHADGAECFDGGWFIVHAELPTGPATNHYPADAWDLFDVPEAETAPEWDGHTAADAADRLRDALAAPAPGLTLAGSRQAQLDALAVADNALGRWPWDCHAPTQQARRILRDLRAQIGVQQPARAARGDRPAGNRAASEYVGAQEVPIRTLADFVNAIASGAFADAVRDHINADAFIEAARSIPGACWCEPGKPCPNHTTDD